MLVEKNVPLQALNTFRIVAKAHTLVRIRMKPILQALLADPESGRRPNLCWVVAATSC